MSTYDPQRSRSRPRAADDDTPAPVDEILGADADKDAPGSSFDEPPAREGVTPEAPMAIPEPPSAPITDPMESSVSGAGGIPREAFIGFAAAVLVIVALVLRRRRRRRRRSNGD